VLFNKLVLRNGRSSRRTRRSNKPLFFDINYSLQKSSFFERSERMSVYVIDENK
jgi:hypothetical protein